MFGFLKEKLKGVVDKFSKTVDEEGEEAVEDVKEDSEEKIDEDSKKDYSDDKLEEVKEPSSEEDKDSVEEKDEESEVVEDKENTVENKVEEVKDNFAEKKADEIKEDKFVEDKVEVIDETPAPEPKGFFSRLKDKITGADKKKDMIDEIKGSVEFAEYKDVSRDKKFIQQDREKHKIEEDEKNVLKDVKEHIHEAKKDLEEGKKKEAVKEIKKAKEEIQIVKAVEEKKGPTAEQLVENTSEDEVKQTEDNETNVEEEASGFLGKLKQKIVTKKINKEQFESMFWDLEVVLLENNVAVEVIDKIKKELQLSLVDKPIKRSMIENTIIKTLKNSIDELFIENIDILNKIKEKKPYVICFVGINGSGKTTTIAKFAYMLKKNGVSTVMAAGDTFRAAAIEQLKQHADKLDVKLISHDYGSDAAAVAFDAVKYAESKNIDCVLIDTAGRLHSNVNLMQELKKLVRVAKPDLNIFVGEAITGNDCVEQAQKFKEEIGIDGIILAKADVDEKGGASISVSYVTKKPILYLGTGQEYDNLEKFNKDVIIKSLGIEG